MDKQLLGGADPRIYVTNPDDPEEGRIFIYAKARWYERESGPWGDVVYPHVADQEEDLDDYMAQDGSPEDLTELDPDDDDFARSVAYDFMTQSPLYPEAPETSDEPPFAEREVEVESEFLHYDEQTRNEGG